ncbi:MAG: thioredoxin [Lachnospiraceae bacterium]|jgi:thioredoxin 1|nr:thioredoxin [Lachnospiraceae bacterium]MCR5389481.1 thioredoxin [Lachnospiraceae bacterium]
MAAITLTLDNFEEEVLNSKEPVLVDFWAPWCGPCRMLSPIVDQVAEATEGVKIGKVNVDEQEELADRYSIMSVPALKFFKNGEVVKDSTGFIPKEKIEEMIRS